MTHTTASLDDLIQGLHNHLMTQGFGETSKAYLKQLIELARASGTPLESISYTKSYSQQLPLLFVISDALTQIFEDMGTPLHEDASFEKKKTRMRQGAQSLIKMLLAEGVSIDQKVDKDCTLLHMACFQNQFEWASFLLREGANPNIRTEDGEVALHFSIGNCDLELTRALIANGADIHLEDYEGRNLMTKTLRHPTLEITRFLVDQGYDLTRLNPIGRSFVALATLQGNLEAVRFFIDQGLDPDLANLKNESPLYLAAMNGNVSIAQELLKYPVDVHRVTAKDKLTALHEAVADHNPQMVQLLLEHGAYEDINRQDCEGYTPLHLLAGGGYKSAQDSTTEITQLLLSYHPDLTLESTSGRTVLSRAESFNPPMARLIQEYELAKNERDILSETTQNLMPHRSQSGQQTVIKPVLMDSNQSANKNTGNETTTTPGTKKRL